MSIKPEPVFWRFHNIETDTTWIEEFEPNEEDWTEQPEIEWYRVSLAEINSQELAGLMDAAMENANYHASAGIHGYLRKVLIETVGEAAALRILARIYIDHGWLAEIHS
jgi:hypothetical protein